MRDYARMTPQAKAILKLHIRWEYAEGKTRERFAALIKEMEWAFPHAATEVQENYGALT